MIFFKTPCKNSAFDRWGIHSLIYIKVNQMFVQQTGRCVNKREIMIV